MEHFRFAKWRERLRSAIADLVDDPERREAMGAQAAERVKGFSSEAVGERYRELLADMAGSATA